MVCGCVMKIMYTYEEDKMDGACVMCEGHQRRRGGGGGEVIIRQCTDSRSSHSKTCRSIEERGHAIKQV